jgi:lysophospholipase L1-like esterase
VSRLLPFVLLTVLIVPSVSAAAGDEVPRIVALGDSLTSGHGIGKADAYPAVLQARLDDGGYHYRGYEELAQRFSIPLVPSVVMKVMTVASLMRSDRAHPNQAGARVLADLVWPYLEPLLKKSE